MSEVMRLPRLDSEPRAAVGSSKHAQPFAAPPSYRSTHYSAEDDVSSALWSEHSSASSALGKRRSSWTNLVESDQNLKRYDPNVYPKVSGSLNSIPSAQRVCVFPAVSTSSKCSDNTYHTKARTGQQHYPLGYQPSTAETASISTGVSGVCPLGRQVAYAPSRQSVLSEYYHTGNVRKFNESIPPPSQGSELLPPKRDRMQSIREFCARPFGKLVLLLLILIVIAGIIVAIVLSQTLVSPKHFNFWWLAPSSLRQNDETPNKVTVDIDGNQAKVDLLGAMPFKGSYRSVLDFKTNKVAIMDSSLRKDGNYTTCFLMPLDRRNIPDIAALQKAAWNSESKTKQNQGWVETWNFIPQPLPEGQSVNLFTPPIAECKNARWIQLNYIGVYQKSKKCTNCFDFCLPEYGIDKELAETTDGFNILRRNCFYMFVPEWRNFAQDYSGGQNQAPNQFGGLNGALSGVAQNIQQAGQDLQSKWITLQTLPQQVANASQQLFGSNHQAFAGASNNNSNQQPTAFNMQQQQVQPNGQMNQANQFQPSQALGPPYSGQNSQMGQNGQFQIYNQPSSNQEQQQGAQNGNTQTHLFSPNFNPSQQGQQPQNFKQASQPFNAGAPTQRLPVPRPNGYMNGVNGQNNVRYTNQGQYGGGTNFQPNPMFPNTQPQQQEHDSNPNNGRASTYPQVTQAQPQWINVG